MERLHGQRRLYECEILTVFLADFGLPCPPYWMLKEPRQEAAQCLLEP